MQEAYPAAAAATAAVAVHSLAPRYLLRRNLYPFETTQSHHRPVEMPLSTPSNPRKRPPPCELITPEQSITPPMSSTFSKRPRIMPSSSHQGRASSSPFQADSHLPTPFPSETPRLPTTSLELEIPKPPQNKRLEASRKVAARKWVAKLTNPPPNKLEMSRAYSTKLMRHYPPAPNTPVEPNFVKPVIHKSTRVTKLLRRFPGLAIPTGNRISSFNKAQKENLVLRTNKRATATDEASWLAWHSFAIPERTTRVGMMQSGIDTQDWNKEEWGQPNNLPAWMKWRTGKWCDAKGQMEMRRQIDEANRKKMEDGSAE